MYGPVLVKFKFFHNTQLLILGKLSGERGKSISFVVPASTSLLHSSDLQPYIVPSTQEYNNHPLYKIAAYDFANLPKLHTSKNHLIFQSTDLSASLPNGYVAEKKTKHGILYIQPLPSLDLNRKMNSDILPPSSKGNRQNPTHLIVNPTIGRNDLEPVLNAVTLNDLQKMAKDLSRFKVYQAVPEHRF